MADRHPASREKVAQSLLGVVQQLSTPAFIFRPFDHDQQRDATEKITMAQGDLVELGYAVSYVSTSFCDSNWMDLFFSFATIER